MMRYADPRACPDCHATIPSDPDRCPDCALPLRNPTAAELFHTLQRADVLLGRLRHVPVQELTPLTTTTANTPPHPAPVSASAPQPQPQPHAQSQAVREAAPAGSGLRASSVPGVLLGLGALCLLVASVIFLAVAWSWLGVGGRTVVLVALTAAAGGAGVWWARRGLRVAGESLTTVALGLLALDLFGADDAGWLGAASDSFFVPILGASIALAGLGVALAGRRETTTLVAPQLGSALGVLIAYAGLRESFSADLWISGIAVGVAAALALLTRGELPFLRWALVVTSGIIWLNLLGGGLDAIPTPVAFSTLWAGTGWALLTAAAYLAAPALLPALRSTAHWWLGVSAILVTFTLALPAVETSSNGLMLTSLVAAALWLGLAWLLPQPWTWTARLPAIASALPVSIGLLTLIGESLARLGDPAPTYSADITARLAGGETILSPWFLVPAALLLAGLTLAIASDHRPVTRERLSLVAIAILAIGGVLTLGLFPVPIWTAAAALAAVAVVLVGVATIREDRWALPSVLAAGPFFLTALVVAVPSAGLLGVVAFLLTLATAFAAGAARSTPVEVIGYLTVPVGLTIAVHASGDVLDASVTYRAVLVVLLLGVAAIALPRPDLEISAAVAGLTASSVAVTSVDGGAGTLALLLTLSGALVTISALLNPDRRTLGWVGGLLLAAASWVRLADLGVGTPEAYTLPSALALLAVGGWRLHQDPSAATGKLLGPGLVLATLPSLLWVLTDPISLRALLLGAACLGLVLGGAVLRWNAPLMVGASVGTLLVLVELAPYLVQTPQWVAIGLAGAILTIVGVTWESRMQEIRHAGAYLQRLR